MLVRSARLDDAEQVFPLARALAISFRVEREPFEVSFCELVAQDDAFFVVAEDAGRVLGYLLGFDHLSLFANGRVAWVEEVTVREDCRRNGIGKKLMAEFEEWAAARECRLIALATRRAPEFYQALGYLDTAAYFRKVL